MGVGSPFLIAATHLRRKFRRSLPLIPAASASAEQAEPSGVVAVFGGALPFAGAIGPPDAFGAGPGAGTTAGGGAADGPGAGAWAQAVVVTVAASSAAAKDLAMVCFIVAPADGDTRTTGTVYHVD